MLKPIPLAMRVIRKRLRDTKILKLIPLAMKGIRKRQYHWGQKL
ncbi:hypothetical protein PSTT_14124 [Puccinia striiformis]|uniref:Uncharacterized protein n=1 Tax=Puccinia striiformis TaxID=27350 RepID=A0A2S4UNM7_9BASI|nr:hypothetical protein PSTT_14124 [Puccinia striiformis]